jgi:hypothetical protein
MTSGTEAGAAAHLVLDLPHQFKLSAIEATD